MKRSLIAGSAFTLFALLLATWLWLRADPKAFAPDVPPAARRVHLGGHVRDLRGRGLATAAVHSLWIGADAEPRGLDDASTGADGAWSLDADLPAETGVLLLVATSPGHETSGRRVDPGDTRQEFVLADGGARLTVRVTDRTGTPVPGASVLVSIEPQAGDAQAALVLTGVTTRSGEKVFEAVAGAAAQLHWTARAKSRGSASGTQQKGWGHAPVVVEAVLSKGAAVSGIARVENAPAEGVTLSLHQSAGAWGEKVRTAPGGDFKFAEVPTGEPLELEVLSAEYMLADGQDLLAFNVPKDADRHELKIDLLPAGMVTGIVAAKSGPLVGGALIEALPSDHRMGTRRAATSTADGRFRIGGLRTDTAWSLEAKHPDYASAFVDDVRPSRSGTPVRLTLIQGGAIAGMVQYQDGEPAHGVEIYVHRTEQSGDVVRGLREHATVTTNLEGHFKVEHLTPGPLRVEARARARMGWSPIAAQVVQTAIEEGITRWIDPIAVARGGVLHAELVTPTPDPAEQFAEVSFMQTGARGAPHTVIAQRAADGSVRVSELEAGEYDLSVRLASHGMAHATIRIRSGQTAIVQLEFADAEALAGLLRHSDGTPAVDALIEAYQPESGSQRTYPIGGRAPDNLTGNKTRTNGEGQFRIAGLQPGRYIVRAQHPAEAPLERPVDVVAGRDPIELRFPPGAVCEVRLLNQREQPVGDKIIVLQSPGEGRHTTSGITDANGVAKFERLPAGIYRARAVASGQPTAECDAKPGRLTKASMRSGPERAANP